MSSKFDYSLEDLGFLSAGFFVANAAFQIPAGLISARRGAKYAALLALGIITVSSFLSILSGDFYFQFAIRFVTGLGAAFFFAPVMSIAAETLGPSRSGFAVGIYNGTFNIGAGFALLVFTPLSVLDWRLPFAITAVLTLIAFVQNSYALKNLPAHERKIDATQVRASLTSRDIWIALSCVLGASGAFYVVSQFIVSYSEGQLRFSPNLAGVISSFVLVGAVFGSPIGGWLSDRFRNRRFFIMISVVGGTSSIALFSVPGPYAPWIAAFTCGFFFASANTNSLAYPTQVRSFEHRYVPIAIGLMNAVSTFVGSGYTIAFAAFVILLGYNSSWVLISLLGLIFAPLIYLAVEPNKLMASQTR